MCELLSSATADDVEAMVVACDPIRTAAVAAKKSGNLSAAVAGYKEILRMQSNLLASSIVIVLIPLRLCLLLSSPFPRVARLLAFTRVGKPHSLAWFRYAAACASPRRASFLGRVTCPVLTRAPAAFRLMSALH